MPERKMASKFIKNEILGPQESALRMKKNVERRPDRIPDARYSGKVERRPDRIPDVRHPEKVERWLDRILDVKHPGGMAMGKNFGYDMSGWNVGGGKNSGCDMSG